MKKILLISTGGTISSSETELGLSPRLKFDDLIAKVTDLRDDVTVEGVQLMNIDSGNIDPSHWVQITRQVKDTYDQYDGFVITHGTDTLAYTSAALSYMIQNSSKPIVLTGSQRPIEMEGSDGVKNLSRSIRVACQDIGGVFVMFDNKVIMGTGARKIKSKSDDAFVSLNIPYIAVFEGNEILLNDNLIAKLRTEDPVIFYRHLNSNVALIKLAPGIRPDILHYIADHYDAVVIEAYGVGSIPFETPNNFLEALEQITEKGCIALVVSQALNQGTYMQKYEISRKALFVDNVIEGGLLSSECAITKLMWAMGQSGDHGEIKRLINNPVALDKVKFFNF